MPADLKEALLGLPVALGLKKSVLTPWATQISAGEWNTPKNPPSHNLAVYGYDEVAYKEKLFGENPPYLLLVSTELVSDTRVDEIFGETRYKRSSPAIAAYPQAEERIPIPPVVYVWWIVRRDDTEKTGSRSLSDAARGLASAPEHMSVSFAVSEPYTALRDYPAMDFTAAQNSQLTTVSAQDAADFVSPLTTASQKPSVLGPVVFAAAVAAATFYAGKALRRKR
jgi:hypothetical protein